MYKKINDDHWLIVDPPVDAPIRLGCFWTHGRTPSRRANFWARPNINMDHTCPVAGAFSAHRILFI